MGNIFSISLSLDPIITRCWDCATGQASYICNLKGSLNALQEEVDKLKELRDDLMSRVKNAEDQQHKRVNQVEGLLQRADHVMAEADQLSLERPQQVEKLCMGGCCSRHPSDVASKPPLPSATKRPSKPTVGLESCVNQVWSSLQNDQVGIIGIYGLGGVGKTTLLNQMIKVASQDRPIEKVQDEIAERIGLSNEGWKSKSLEKKVGDIFKVLCKKKFALLLDDIWERFDLTRAGIPIPTQENGSKVIFTTRRLDVCCQMQPNMASNIRVECLPPQKALKLFEEKVGLETLQMHPDIRKLAKAVVEECAGLPLALITIGRAMASKKTPREWEYCIEVLRKSAASVFPRVGKEMYPKLKFSYDCLPDERLKSCFLYCSLYPEDHPIEKDQLIHCWIGEGLLDKHTDLTSTGNQGNFIIGSLTEVYLLEKGPNSDRVKMHDMIRDMALWIAGESKKMFFVKAGAQLKEQPEAEKLEEVIRMSLMDNRIENLTKKLACPNLQNLFLGRNCLKMIINDFFNFMPMLRVLDLSSNINLANLPVGIAKLVSLEHLNLSHTNIRKLPNELNALEKLKYLNLEWTRALKMIPRQLISSFSKLQVLKMEQCDHGCSLVLEEIVHLKYLKVLTISVTSASELKKVLEFSKSCSCTIEGITIEEFINSWSMNILALANHLYNLKLSYVCNVEEVKIASNIIKDASCFQSFRFITLVFCEQLRDASWVSLAPHLECLRMSFCTNLEEIISEEKLGEIAESKANINLFSKLKLKAIRILNCPMLKKLPLNSYNAKGHVLIIEGEEGWWKNLEWEDESTKTAFLPSFKCRG
ncbi:hypothetical protein V6Z11_A01G020900 [Gossypium hirsutum]